MPNTTAAGRTARRARTLTGALAIAALLAALMALWQTQFRPLSKPEYCWGTWRADGGPFRTDAGRDGGAHRRTARETAPTPARPHGRCSLSWSGGRGRDAPRRSLEVRYETGPSAAKERRAWLAELFAGGDAALPDDLPGFVTAATGTLVLPASCDVDGRPSVVTVSGSFDSSPDRTGRILLEAANRATKVTGCAGEVRTTGPTTPTGCSLPLPAPRPAPASASAPPAAPGTAAGSAHDGFQTCAVAGGGQWAARFTMVARPRIVTLFDGLTGDSPPAPGWRALGRIEATAALIRADCAGRPTVFTMRTGPGRTGTRLDDAREAFPPLVEAAADRMGCAPLHSV
ncbi:hypothetical protein [Streptomyces cinnamoneus]|uniref:Uncharacterized protein n=1 Tax=Streptomyces cinnamoneus TaxID=53446 RepID=A0A918TSK0_STRCJ|nr:hypothetical protein [Streptomyces cinnamoneus]GHC61364.1 hypothetical protein GCM10010507_43110 [Streptomyces cinnamoneus]